MPSFRSIEISIVASSGVKLPEYPHPDASSVRLARIGAGPADPRSRGRNSPHPFSSSTCSEADPARQKKVNPRISVYIPSSPGEQFRLNYLVNQSSSPSRFVFFKMFINGHHTVSWGIDTSSSSVGSVTRGLYKPSDGLRRKNGDAAVGIETRCFHFMPRVAGVSVAEDGGLIEVQVFRCQGRKRIAPELDPYPQRNQGRYGIASLSGGLVDNPQDATFYEYHLEDARDSPYATFYFHYRSVKYLEQLNIIPQNETRLRPVSIGSCNSSISNPAISPPAACQFVFGVESLNTPVFYNSIRTTSVAVPELSQAHSLEEYILKSPPELPPARPTDVAPEKPKQVRGDLDMAELLQRPLPELPKVHLRQASEESLRSNCPSLTPSLKRYAKSEDFENEEIRLSIAQHVVIPSESMQALELGGMNTHDQEDTSFSDYAASPTSSDTSESPALPSPNGYLPTTGSVLERQLSQFGSPIAQSSPKAKAKLPPSRSEGDLGGDMHIASADTLKLTESEWLRRSPSPPRRQDKLLRRLWSPRPQQREGRSSMVELPTRGGPSKDGTGSAGDVPTGNWV
ncbi:hypothetical protein F4677DRAFT_435348 [Hypoxylon crocopeplum]|nr:hypothetical protein F4677DRAFT_435348 [Hypoxylon crocopeplum]